MKTKIAYVLGMFALLPAAAFAQEELGDEVKSVEIRVVEEYKAQVRSAHKITEQPSFADSTSAKIPVKVRIQPKAMDIAFTPKAIPAIQIGRVKLAKLPTQQVAIGGGNFASSFASFVISSPRSKKNVWGVRALHEGALSGVSGTQFKRQPRYENEVLADFQRATHDWNFKTQALIKADYVSYYGAMDQLPTVLDSVPGNWQSTFGLSQEWLKTVNPTSKVLATYRKGGASYRYMNAGHATSEHLFKTAHRIELNADDRKVLVDMGYQFAGVNSWADTSGAQYHNFSLEPYTSGKNGILTYEFGLNFTGTQSAGLDTNGFEFYVFPRINLQAEVLRRTLAIYGGWDGNVQQNTLQELVSDVPYLTMNQEYRLSGQNRGYVGMQGALVGKLQYRVEGSMAFMNDAVVFERDSTAELVHVNGNQLAALQVGYANRVVRTGVRGELNMPLKNFTASTYAQLNVYGGDPYLGQEGRILGALVSYRINELSVMGNFKYVGGRYQQEGYSLEDYADLSAAVGYEINDNLSVSLKLHNLLNQQYQIWEGYRVRGTRGLFTLNYQF